MSPTNGDDALTREVLESFAGSADPRVREILQSLTRHLHAFVADVGLQESEWATAIDFLTRTGQTCTPTRQEFILLSDVLGVSMRTVAQSHPADGEVTQSTVLGPFFVEGSPAFSNGDDLANGAPGSPCLIRGTVRGEDGAPVPGVRMEVWQADEDGFYDVQLDGVDGPRNRGHLFTDDEGRYAFWASRPVAYPIPDDGPVGELLAAGARGPWRPAHVHFMLTADGYAPITTHVFDASDQYLSNDAVFGVKDSLVAEFDEHEPGEAPDGRRLDEAWYSLDYDFVMARAGG
jgi:hydroxyquinol 1,2-dioxygenase